MDIRNGITNWKSAMCARYEQNSPPGRLIERFGLAVLPEFNFPDGEIRPTDRAVAVLPGGKAVALPWGLPAPWDGKPLINARAETLEEKQTFRPLLEQRCLVPATAYFEWRKAGSAKLKNRIARRDGEPFAFAGLTDGERFTIVTCVPGRDVEAIHSRMPVILAPEREADWIAPGRHFADCRELLEPTRPGTLTSVEDQPVQHDLFG